MDTDPPVPLPFAFLPLVPLPFALAWDCGSAGLFKGFEPDEGIGK